MIRLALCGASGTGKSTIAEAIAAQLSLPICPVGSRSVAASMGFDNPYDVDAAGKRSEFQRALLSQKIAWEREVGAFVTDRTHLDNLAYTLMHAHETADEGFRTAVRAAMPIYTHIVFCPVDAFHNLAGDPARVNDVLYHSDYQRRLRRLLNEYVDHTPILWLTSKWRDTRIEQVRRFVRP